MKVCTIPTPRDQLAAIPVRERTFVLGFGHVANEISVLQKVFYWASCSSNDNDLLKKAHTTQAVTLARVLAGKLYEAWRFLEKAFFGTRLSKEWEPQLDPESTAALQSLKEYFGLRNAIGNTRNSFAFHYSVDEIAKGFELPSEEDGWLIVMSESRVNSLYYVSDLIANYAMLENIHPGNKEAAIKTLIADITNVARWVVDLAGGVWIVASEMYLLKGDQKFLVKEYDISNVPSIDNVQLPFFVEASNNAAEHGRLD